MSRSFMEMIQEQWTLNHFVGVALDPRRERLPPSCTDFLYFNQRVVDQTKNSTGCYQLNPAHYDMLGLNGRLLMAKTIKYIQQVAPDVPVIIDGMFSGTSDASEGTAHLFFDDLGVNAVSINPYLGRIANLPFLQRRDKGVLVVCRTSNDGSGEMQDMPTCILGAPVGNPLYKQVAWRSAIHWNDKGNVGLVIGANYPGELGVIREMITKVDEQPLREVLAQRNQTEVPIFIPGLGLPEPGQTLEQKVKESVVKGISKDATGLMIVAGRWIAHASKGPDFADAAAGRLAELNGYVEKYRAPYVQAAAEAAKQRKRETAPLKTAALKT